MTGTSLLLNGRDLYSNRTLVQLLVYALVARRAMPNTSELVSQRHLPEQEVSAARCRTIICCECLGTSFSGRHCEITSKDTLVRQVVSKTFGYIAIIALVTVALFVLTMDVMKYVFGIDVAHEEANGTRWRSIQTRKAPPLMLRLIYVNHPTLPN